MSEVLSALGVLIAAAAAAAALVLAPGRARAAAMLLALALFPLLILGDQWNTPQIADLRDNTAIFLTLGAAAVLASVLAAAIFHRHPLLLPLAIVAALPFRIPLESGGDTANLLVPLYLVIAGGALSSFASAWRPGWGAPRRELVSSPRQEPKRPPQSGFSAGGAPPWLLPAALAAAVLLYALQTFYSPDFSKSLQNVCFFFVPFSLAYALLSEVTWDKKLLRLVLLVVAAEAVAFVAVGSIEYVTRELFWNDQVIRSNEFHTYFRVNSIFWDPNIYGRYLALTIVIAMAVLLWTREQKTFALLTALVAVLWLGLVPTFSQSSFAALLVGLAVLAALRWSWRWTLAAVGAGAILAVVIVIFAGGVSKLSPDRLNVDTGGRTNLASGGLKLFRQRPVSGYGAGSFPRAYREHAATKKTPVSVSHTEPITVAAEQGLLGILAYAALVFAALWTMTTGLSWGAPTQAPQAIARIAVLAAFAALLVHTLAYASFYEDPITWTLLAIAASLAAASAPVRSET